MSSIFIKDDLRASVEAASGGQQTVLYTKTGQPCYMNIVPKFRVEDIDASLGTGVHPAFTVGGVEKNEIFVGTYQGISKNGELLSLPGVDPTTSQNHDQFVALARANGTGWHCMTNAEWAAIQLWCWRNGTLPRGNSNWGKSSDSGWETGRRIDGGQPGSTSGTGRTLAGSGPASWRHDNTHAGISDLCGNILEWSPGMRLVDGEIQIIPNNDAALNAKDLGSTSAAWKAIKASDGTLVTPGTAGTLKYDAAATVTGNGSQQAVLSDTRTNLTTVSDTEYYTAGTYESMAVKSGLTAPAIAKLLGLYPLASSGLGADAIYVRNVGERLPVRGGYWGHGSGAGVFALYLDGARSGVYWGIGSRPAFVL